MTIAVTGAAGQLGQLVVEKLKGKTGEAIVALVRSPAKAAGLGVAVREADYTKPAMLKPALAGVDALLSISSSEIGQRVAQHHNVIEAEKAAGVRRIVYTSLLHADVSPISLAVEHRETEAELKASGIPYTILRNSWYTENHTSSIGGALAGGAVIGSAGNGKFSSATRADYAEAAVAALAGKGHEGKIYELPETRPIRFRTSLPRFRDRRARPSPTRICPRRNMRRRSPDSACRRRSPRRSRAGTSTRQTGRCSTAAARLSALIGRPTTPLSSAVAEALAAVSKA